MLNRGGGTAAFQKVVNKVSDLPSPLDAEPGSRIIVRETEEVYGLNSTTRMWEAIGTLKKVGGKKPEELAAHVDAGGNPHRTTLQDILNAGTAAEVTSEIKISGKGARSSLRLLSGTSGVRVGEDAGNSDGAFWTNVDNGRRAAFRAVGAAGEDRFVVDGAGSVVSSGYARFSGGFKGPAAFDDEITATEGVRGADGFDLVLGGDKGVLFKVGGVNKALLTDSALSVEGNLTVKSLGISGTVTGNLNPSKTESTLGAKQARWGSVTVTDIDANGQVFIQIPPNSQKPPVQISSYAPGNDLVVTSSGCLGLGTAQPTERLDVRGALVVGGGEARLRIDGAGLKGGDWEVRCGSALLISHQSKPLIKADSDGLNISGNTTVSGNLAISGNLVIDGVSGSSGQSISFTRKGAAYVADSHTLVGPLKIVSDGSIRPLELPGLIVEAGNVIGGGSLGSSKTPWTNVHVKDRVNVGQTSFTSGSISHQGDFVVDSSSLVVNRLKLKSPQIDVPNELKLSGAVGSATFSMSGPVCGLSFSGARRWVVEGVGSLSAEETTTGTLKVAGAAQFASGAVSLNSSGLQVTGELNVGGLSLKRITEEITLDGVLAHTAFELPAGVLIKAVIVKIKSDVVGARLIQIGDHQESDRFCGPSVDLKAGSVLRGFNHWDRGRAVQRVKGPVVVSCDANATGKLQVTVHYVDLVSV